MCVSWKVYQPRRLCEALCSVTKAHFYWQWFSFTLICNQCFSHSVDCRYCYKYEVYVCLNYEALLVLCFLGRISKGFFKTNTSKRRLSILIYLRRREWWMLHTEPHSFHSLWGTVCVLMDLSTSVLDRLRCSKVKIYCLVCPKTNNFQVKM